MKIILTAVLFVLIVYLFAAPIFNDYFVKQIKEFRNVDKITRLENSLDKERIRVFELRQEINNQRFTRVSCGSTYGPKSNPDVDTINFAVGKAAKRVVCFEPGRYQLKLKPLKVDP